MSRVVADVTGDREIIRDMLALGKDGIELGKQVLGDVNEKIAKDAKAICPVDDIDGGDLLRDIRVSKPRASAAGRIVSSVIAGGPSLARLVSEKGHKTPGSYASIVHYDPTMKHPNGGRAFFIEEPFLVEAPKVPDLLTAKIDRAHGR